MDPKTVQDLLLKEIDTINENSRVLFQVYIAWLTFFITLLLAAMSAAIKASLKNGVVRYPRIVYFVGTLFAIQVVFGVIACLGFRSELRNMDNRINEITTNIIAVSESPTNLPPVEYIRPQSTIPHIMPLAVDVGIMTLVSHFLLWAFLVMKIRKWSKTKKQVLGDYSD